MNTTKPALKKCMKSMTKPVTANEAIADKEGERNVEELVIDAKAHLFFLQWDVLLNWNPRFQFAKVNPCSGYFLQE